MTNEAPQNGDQHGNFTLSSIAPDGPCLTALSDYNGAEREMALPVGLEPTVYRLGGGRFVQLNYRSNCKLKP